jgi:hypothetical protein
MSSNKELENYLMFNRKQEFEEQILSIVVDANVGYIEAIIQLCEKWDIEPNVAASMLSSPIKEKVRAEAIALNMLESSPKLPF